MSARLADILRSGVAAGCKPWQRAEISLEAWSAAIRALSDGALTLVALWAEPGTAHMALRETDGAEIAVLSVRAEAGQFPSVGAGHLPARRLERRIRDLYGLEPVAAEDLRPWLDHGQFGGARLPSGGYGRRNSPTDYKFLAVEGEGLHEIPVGPVHAGIIEPGHFRFTANGETVVRLEERLGYVHRGIDTLLSGTDLQRAARIAGRASGDTTVAYAIAFSRAAEAAANISIPERASALRALMLELERVANHLGDIGAVCNDAAFSLMHAHCAVLRERVLRVADFAFGHRLMMDCVHPGGVACDLSPKAKNKIAALVTLTRRRFPRLMRLYEDTASLQDRTVGTGVVRQDLVELFGAGGHVGRASGRAFDARKSFAFPPYNSLRFDIAGEETGDVDARVRVRAQEIHSSLSIIDQLLEMMPHGPTNVSVPLAAGEGAAIVEGFRGDIFVWLRLRPDGAVDRAFLRDPSWFQWPLLEAAIENNIVADFPLCNKSFNCSYAGHDL
jgi:Ni,Fe-hydrogenase III large subunit